MAPCSSFVSREWLDQNALFWLHFVWLSFFDLPSKFYLVRFNMFLTVMSRSSNARMQKLCIFLLLISNKLVLFYFPSLLLFACSMQHYRFLCSLHSVSASRRGRRPVVSRVPSWPFGPGPVSNLFLKKLNF